MATEENKALLRRFIELWNTGNVAVADEFVSAELIDHTLLPGLLAGLAGFKLMVGGFRAAFPDLRITIDDLIAQGDKAAARVTFRGTHQGEFQGIPPTGKSFTMGAIGMLRFKDGEVVEHWATLDRLGLLTQLGVAPAQTDLPYATLWPVRSSGSRNGQASDPAANLALVRRFFAEVCNGRQLAVADQLFAAHHRYHDPSIPDVADGPAGIRQIPGPVVPYQSAFSDAHWHVEDMLAEGDTVITRWSGTGTQDGDLPGIPAAGRQVFVPGLWWQRIVDGKIVESWQVWDTLGMLQQLGVIPAPAEIPA
jgi:steroid delta-isomerase-like uncharacterized protein